ncbi:MAG: proline--tRNA ligase [Candidatus Pacearchaeota archaeon]|nr:proline--tRNA ligase [Candidatus Pacearchaeota archaeon]MDE1848493.1 proline--tRNA ligase [Nanoarchaeota archaeon]
MKGQKSHEGLSVKKEDFSEWYTEVLEKAEITDIRYRVKGFMVIRPWGAMSMENMYDLYEKALQKKGHKPTFFPIVIPEGNFKKEAEHIKGFTPEVFWLEKVQGEEKLALRPTSETAMYQMYSIWIRSWRDLPLKLYQRANVFRYETKATRPLIRTREFYWIETHDCFETKAEAERQVLDDIKTTEEIMHQRFGIPFLPMKRPSWDKFAGAEYTVASDTLMPDGKILQQPSTHLLGQNFSKSFDIKFRDENGKEQYVWQTCYGPAISRILASVISIHGDDSGLVMPFCISPIQAVIIPIFTNENKSQIIKEAQKIKEMLEEQGLRIELDSREEKRPGEKFYEWELKGVPFRIEIGEKELKEKKASIFTRDNRKKEYVSFSKLNELKKKGEEYDARLISKADAFMKGKIENCRTKDELKKAIREKKIGRISFCSTENDGIKCAEIIEKDIGASVRGTLADKNEKPGANEKCIICKRKANKIVYVGKSY